MLGADLWEWHKLAGQQKTPVHLILFVTDHCNAKCGTCFYWQNLNQGESLAPDHIEKISAAMGRLVWLDISGGEPFLRKDLGWICRKFVDANGVRFINIPTNAIQSEVVARITRDILATDKPVRLNIAISLDGIGENHDRVRGVPGNYQKAVATLARLQQSCGRCFGRGELSACRGERSGYPCRQRWHASRSRLVVRSGVAGRAVHGRAVRRCRDFVAGVLRLCLYQPPPEPDEPGLA